MSELLLPPTSAKYVISIDEAGRGSFIGDVVAAAVILPSPIGSRDPDNVLWDSIKDSKKIRTHKQREQVAEFIKQVADGYAIGTASHTEVDELNILKATMKAMHRALDTLFANNEDIRPDNSIIYVDGCYFKPDYKDFKHRCVVKGDALVKAISAASILAKTYRDNGVISLVKNYPEHEKYGWLTNMGYGTYGHRKAIKQYGLTPYHRKTFTKNVL